ncbi:MAG: hypothetical protein KME42_05835 [Tildeniella nuda ZEHNDER 1965/U140]|nr:hypothetical protein [Tildeniella nuda ZEHNDER 1965/U140]
MTDTPETAEEEAVRSLMQLGKPLLDTFLIQTQQVAAKLNASDQSNTLLIV